MARYRTRTIGFERQVAEEHLCQGTSLDQLARRHDISRGPLRIWVRRYEAGELAGNGPGKADRRVLEAKVAGLERKVGQLTMELDGPAQKGLASARRPGGASSCVASGPKPAASEPGAGWS
jgi:transposase